MKKTIPEIREREGNEKINSHNLGMGIRGFHSREWTGTGIPAHPWKCIESNTCDSLSGTKRTLPPEKGWTSWSSSANGLCWRSRSYSTVPIECPFTSSLCDPHKALLTVLTFDKRHVLKSSDFWLCLTLGSDRDTYLGSLEDESNNHHHHHHRHE